MCSRGVLVHCPSRLGAAAAVLAAKLPCRDGMLAKDAPERAKAVHHFDCVISHNFKCSRLSRHGSELKLPLGDPIQVCRYSVVRGGPGHGLPRTPGE
jgi:hypothetical protein